MSRRLLLFGLLAASQLSTGCFPCVRERIAWRWHNHHPVGCGPVCAPACGPGYATPAFRIPSPVVGMPVGAPGCSSCSAGIDPGPGPVTYAGPIGGAGFIGAPPVIGNPMPLGAPRIDVPAPMPSNGAKN